MGQRRDGADDHLSQALAGALPPQPPAPSWVLLVALASALVLVGWRPAWRCSAHLVTVAHEGGHAVAALAVGRRLAGIRLHSDTSGVTVSRGRPRGAGVVLVLLAGYPAPALLALAAAGALAAGYPLALLWALVVLLTLLLLQVRNVLGALLVLGTGSALGAVAWWLPGTGTWLLAHVVTAVLLLGAPRAVLELVVARRRGARSSDPDQLAHLTRVPAGLWLAALLLVTASASGAGAWLLTLAPHH